MKKLFPVLLVLMLTRASLFADLPISKENEAAGKIIIPSINCEFDLYYDWESMNEHQHNAWLYVKECWYVGNHYGSLSPTGGQWKTENISVGDKAYVELNGQSCSFLCYAVMVCDYSHTVLSHNGRELVFDPTDLVCVTCVGSDSSKRYAAVFERCE